MGRKTLIGMLAGLTLLVAGAVAAFAYDASKSDEIAEGVLVGDVDVGGLTEGEARDLLTDELVTPLDQPVLVKYKGEKFTLSKNQIDITADIDGMVNAAIAASREDMLPVRVFRDLTGGTVDEQIEPQVAYDQEEVD